MSVGNNDIVSDPLKKYITTDTSVVLDVLRLLAALLVFAEHAKAIWFPEEMNAAHINVSHVAVIIFFVLSGYVIAYTTTVNNRGPEQYVVARLSRLYSIVLPAIIITALIEIIIYNIDPVIHALDYSRGGSWARYIITSFFLNEIWFLTAGPRMNGPLWSLSFECWYYIIFGFWLFKGSGWKSWLLPILAVICAGPKIIVLMPVWLMGCVAYKIKPLNIKAGVAWTMFIITFMCGIIGVFYLPAIPQRLGNVPFVFAAQFITDWLIGFFIALALWFIPYIPAVNYISKNIAGKIRKAADLTFPIYVLHFPFLSLWYIFFGMKKNDYTDMYIGSLMVLIIISIIGFFLESKRKAWTNLIYNIIHPAVFFLQKKISMNKHTVK